MKNLLDAIGSLFVYASPEPFDGYARFLRGLSSKKLRELAGTNSHYSKTILINMILDDMKNNAKVQNEIA
tara:strand:- start:400 stop:609 length:210 start_codon:yes stop_codon:yes gene_type:complete